MKKILLCLLFVMFGLNASEGSSINLSSFDDEKRIKELENKIENLEKRNNTTSNLLFLAFVLPPVSGGKTLVTGDVSCCLPLFYLTVGYGVFTLPFFYYSAKRAYKKCTRSDEHEDYEEL